MNDDRLVLVLEDDQATRAFLLDNLAADGLASRIDPDLPVIVLSGRAGDADRVTGESERSRPGAKRSYSPAPRRLTSPLGCG